MSVLKFKKIITALAFFIIGFSEVHAQSETTNSPSLNLVQDIGIENIQPVSEAQVDFQAVNNSIYIQQIGSNNMVSTTIYSKSEELNLVQNGNANQVKINLVGETTLHNIVQKGSNNVYLEFGSTPNLELERSVMQEGNDHSIVIFGSNSITDKMILNQQGSSKIITIRNFN